MRARLKPGVCQKGELSFVAEPRVTFAFLLFFGLPPSYKAASNTPPNIKIKAVTICSPLFISKKSLVGVQRLICSPKDARRSGLARSEIAAAQGASQ
jgi:hypothetical protein